jgi:hypothetical protein
MRRLFGDDDLGSVTRSLRERRAAVLADLVRKAWRRPAPAPSREAQNLV